MKLLEIKRNGSTKNFTCANGDVYNASAVLSEDGIVLYSSEYWNTDPTNGYNGGLLKKGEYLGIKSTRNVSYIAYPQPIVRLFKMAPNTLQNINKIKTDKDIPDSAYYLPSEVPNPNHDGKYIISYVLLHPGSQKWDYSHGCLTALNYAGFREFDNFINKLSDHEIIVVVVR